MATLYWGGGTGTWDGFTATNWYSDLARTTLAGRAPAADDDVIFDSASNATSYTVTIADGTTVCRNVNIAGPASGNLTLAGNGGWYIYGNLTLPATGLSVTFTGIIRFYGTGSHTITTNGVGLASTTYFAGSGTYTLQDALNIGNATIQINAGTFDTNSKNLTCGTLGTAAGSSGTLTLGASTVSATAIAFNSSAFILNAGTSNITVSSTGAQIGANDTVPGNTFYNVTFSSNAISTANIYGNNTFNNLTFTSKASATVSKIVLYGNQTVTGTLTVPGASSVNRYFIRSNLVGTPRTLTVGAVAALTDVDFRDITVAGASSPWSGTRLGNCGGNTNITFVAQKVVYWNKVAGGVWSDTAWATSSGGAPAAANFPLAQDYVVLNSTGLNSGATIGAGTSDYNVGTILTSFSVGYNASITGNLTIYEDLNTGNGVIASSFSPTFAGRVTQNFTSGGVTYSSVTINGYNASVLQGDTLTVNTLTITSGGLNTNNQSLTVNTGVTVSTANTGAFTLTLGSSAVSIAGTNPFSSSSTSAPTMTVSAGTSTITLTNGAANFGFVGQTLTWYNVTRSAASSGGTIYGNNTFNNLTFTAPSATGVSNLSLLGNQTINGTLALGGGTSVIQRFGIVSSTVGTQRTISAATVTGLTDVDFRDINATGAANWTSGTRLGDCGGNSGITFPAAKTIYWNLAGTNNWSATAWATGSGGTPSANNFPLAQDTAVFDNTGAAGTVTMNGAWHIGTISAGGRTSAWTLSGSSSPNVYGNITYGSGITASNTGTYNFVGRGTQTYTTAGKSLSNAIVINKPAGTFQHGDAYTASGTAITITAGTYTTQNYNISCFGLVSTNSNTRSITLGTSAITCSGTNVLDFTDPTNLTFSGASSTINLSTPSNLKQFTGGGQTFGTVSVTGATTNPLTIFGSNKFGTLTNSAFSYLVFASGTTQEITTFSYSGAAGNVVRWYTTTPGQQATIKTASNTVGANSTNGGNNLGLSFTGSSPNYLYVKDIAFFGASAGGSGNFLAFFPL